MARRELLGSQRDDTDERHHFGPQAKVVGRDIVLEMCASRKGFSCGRIAEALCFLFSWKSTGNGYSGSRKVFNAFYESSCSQQAKRTKTFGEFRGRFANLRKLQRRSAGSPIERGRFAEANNDPTRMRKGLRRLE